MKLKSIFLSLFLIGGTIACLGRPLRFNSDGTFKIVQFTDIHFDLNKPENSRKSLAVMESVLSGESPDIVLLTGDIVTANPILEGWQAVLEPILKRKLPFAVTFGNHDDEGERTRSEIMEFLITVPGCMNPKNSIDFDGVLPVISGTDPDTKALLYLFDSHSYSTLPDVKGYGWFSTEQIVAFKHRSDSLHRQIPSGKLPALAFMHIPLPEYGLYYQKSNGALQGKRTEDECPGALNTGMFAALKMAGDVMGVFCGHDHDNDYLVNAEGIALAYGRFTGSKNTYTSFENGARVISLKEGMRNFETYVVLESGDRSEPFLFDPTTSSEK